MIEYCYETGFKLQDEAAHSEWLKQVIQQECGKLIRLVYVFCDDDYLLDLNKRYLNHDTLTDILTFPYEEGKHIHSEIYISVPRVRENAKERSIPFEMELRRVMVHGVLHLFGYKDDTKSSRTAMRKLEDAKLEMFHVEQ